MIRSRLAFQNVCELFGNAQQQWHGRPARVRFNTHTGRMPVQLACSNSETPLAVVGPTLFYLVDR